MLRDIRKGNCFDAREAGLNIIRLRTSSCLIGIRHEFVCLARLLEQTLGFHAGAMQISIYRSRLGDTGIQIAILGNCLGQVGCLQFQLRDPLRLEFAGIHIAVAYSLELHLCELDQRCAKSWLACHRQKKGYFHSKPIKEGC